MYKCRKAYLMYCGCTSMVKGKQAPYFFTSQNSKATTWLWCHRLTCVKIKVRFEGLVFFTLSVCIDVFVGFYLTRFSKTSLNRIQILQHKQNHLNHERLALILLVALGFPLVAVISDCSTSCMCMVPKASQSTHTHVQRNEKEQIHNYLRFIACALLA